jgi:hypothetical protein
MNTKVIDWSYYTGPVPGYGDCRAVVGEYACLHPDRHVESFLGIAALHNGENINYLRIPHAKGDGRMAGGGQSSDTTLEWDVTHWAPRGAMFGPNAVIYGKNDAFTQVTSTAEYQATGGWRYLNAAGALIPCVTTYADVARGIYEFTDFGDVAIGQGANGIAVVSFPGEQLRYLDPRPASQHGTPSDARFMHSDRAGSLFGIAIVELKSRKTYFVWATLAELRALPFVGTVPPVEPPVSTDYLETNKRVRAKYPRSNPGGSPLGGDHAAYLVDLAQQTGTLLYEKKDSNSVAIPGTGTTVSLDVVGRGTMGDNWADVLQDSEGQAVPIWNVTAGAAGTYIDVSGIPIPGEPGTIPPVGNTHRYVGGGNDTGTCDQCGQPRVSDIHRVPEGKVPHTPYLGEDGIGDCDLCFKPVSDPIHSGTVPPTGDLEQRVEALEAAMAAIHRSTAGWL